MPGAVTFYMAWVDAVETTWSSAYLRFDEQMLSLEGEQKEGSFATLSVVIKNPYEGLLAAGRKQWAWFTYKEGSEIIPFFFGQIVALPDDTEAEKITLKFVAKPLDYVAQQTAVSCAMKVSPFYDPIFIRAELRDDPNTVLEGYPSRWHIDRVTHVVSASHILEGEDGIEDILESDEFYNSFQQSTVRNPINQVNLEAAVTWTQSASGALATSVKVMSYTGEAIYSGWPKPGNLSAGWTVVDSNIFDVWNVATIQNYRNHFEWHNPAKKHHNGDPMSITVDESGPSYNGPANVQLMQDDRQVGLVWAAENINIPATLRIKKTIIPLWTIEGNLTLRYDAARKRAETLKLALTADLQPLLAEGESEVSLVENITLQGADVGVAIDGTIPIGDLSLASFFPTDRGLQAVEYAISIGRARLLYGSRVREITRGIHFRRALLLSCRKSARVYDHRIGGGVAEGKIVGYKFSANVTKGRADGQVTIGCAIGNGGAVSGTLGDPIYISDNYIEPGYYRRSGEISAFPSSDIGYAPPVWDASLDDDGLVFPLNVRNVLTVAQTGSVAEQAAYLAKTPLGDLFHAQSADAQSSAQQKITDYINGLGKAAPIKLELRLKPVAGGSFANEYVVQTTNLVAPKQIDLAAPRV